MKDELSFLLEHTKLGFCWLDLIALIILIVVIVWFIIGIHKQKRQEKDLEDEISELTADASMDEEGIEAEQAAEQA